MRWITSLFTFLPDWLVLIHFILYSWSSLDFVTAIYSVLSLLWWFLVNHYRFLVFTTTSNRYQFPNRSFYCFFLHHLYPIFDSGRLGFSSWYSLLYPLSLLLLLLSIKIYTITATNTRRNTSYWIQYRSGRRRRRRRINYVWQIESLFRNGRQRRISISDQTHPLIYYVIFYYYYSRGIIGRKQRIPYNY